MSVRTETLAAVGDKSQWPRYTVVVTDEAEGMWRQRETDLPGFVEFAIYEVQGVDDDGRILYLRDGATASGDHVYNPAEAQTDASGSVKWDGCANWSAGSDVLVHWCREDDAQAWAAALFRAYQMAAEWMDVEGNVG